MAVEFHGLFPSAEIEIFSSGGGGLFGRFEIVGLIHFAPCLFDRSRRNTLGDQSHAYFQPSPGGESHLVAGKGNGIAELVEKLPVGEFADHAFDVGGVQARGSKFPHYVGRCLLGTCAKRSHFQQGFVAGEWFAGFHALFGAADEAVAAGDVLMDFDVAETFGAEHSDKVGGEKGIDFEIESAAAGKRADGDRGNAAVENQRFGVGHEQGGMGLIVKHVAIHRRLLRVSDIGRIAHYDVEAFRGGLPGENILPDEIDVGMERAGVFACDFQCCLGDVDGSDVGERQIAGESYGNRPRAGADVEHPEVLAPLVPVDNQVDEFFRLMARNEHRAVNFQIHPVKPGFAENILQGFVLAQPADDILNLPRNVIRYRHVGIDHLHRSVPAFEGMPYQRSHGPGFAGAIERREVAPHRGRRMGHVAGSVGRGEQTEALHPNGISRCRVPDRFPSYGTRGSCFPPRAFSAPHP